MQAIKILEIQPRKSRDGKAYWHIRYQPEGRRGTESAYLWDPKLAEGLEPGQIKLAELKLGEFPRIVSLQDGSGGEFAPTPSRDESMARYVALKAAAQVANLGASPEEILATAERFLQWLQGGEPAHAEEREE